jgi:DNA-binding MarR family transcriptional regulator
MDDVDAVQRALETLFRLNASRKVHARQAAAAGVVVSQPGVLLLRRIDDHGPSALGELAKVAHMDPAAAGRQVRQLEADGLVRRSASRDDGRVTVVDLTARGRAVSRRITRVRDQHMADVLTQWSSRDRAELGRLLTRFVDDLRAERYRDVVDQRAG